MAILNDSIIRGNATIIGNTKVIGALIVDNTLNARENTILDEGKHFVIGTNGDPASNIQNYISAGRGFDTTSGKEGIKIVCCDQNDCVSGLGQDLTSQGSKTLKGYNFCIAGCNHPTTNQGSISFVTHTKGDTDYRELGYFNDDAGTIKFVVDGDADFKCLELKGGIELKHPNNTPYIDFHNAKNGGDYDIRIISNSDSYGLSIVSGSGTADLTVSGQINATSFNATSDKRLKENIIEYKPAKSILELPIYKYDFINGSKNQIGCLAQDLQEICPEIVSKDNNGYLSIQESKIVYLLLEEVKKLRKEIETLKNN